MKTDKERLQDLLSYLKNLSHVKVGEVPDIGLYIDQVTTFIGSHLKDMRRHPGNKVLVKAVISNYAKDSLPPPPMRKKYSKDYTLMLVFIYYPKDPLSFSDIEELFHPIMSKHFSGRASRLSLEGIYNEVFTLEKGEMNNLKSDVAAKFAQVQDTFSDTSMNDRDRKYLKLFAFIYELSFDVYLKTRIIETTADQLKEGAPTPHKRQTL